MYCPNIQSKYVTLYTKVHITNAILNILKTSWSMEVPVGHVSISIAIINMYRICMLYQLIILHSDNSLWGSLYELTQCHFVHTSRQGNVNYFK